jgi:hypothetical protein
VHQLIQIGGALFILAAFTAAQSGRLDSNSRGYLALNLVGSSVLTYDALHGQEWGFFVLEFVWALVSAWGLLRGRVAAPSGARPASSAAPSARPAPRASGFPACDTRATTAPRPSSG